eukprot:1143281-Pelagomonas_calceolata.AAC.4
MAVGSSLSGVLADALVARGIHVTQVRKAVQTVAFLVPAVALLVLSQPGLSPQVGFILRVRAILHGSWVPAVALPLLLQPGLSPKVGIALLVLAMLHGALQGYIAADEKAVICTCEPFKRLGGVGPGLVKRFEILLLRWAHRLQGCKQDLPACCVHVEFLISAGHEDQTPGIFIAVFESRFFSVSIFGAAIWCMVFLTKSIKQGNAAHFGSA